MSGKKNILAIIGSASRDSANQKLVALFAAQTKGQLTVNVHPDLKLLPHFDPETSAGTPPQAVQDFRDAVAAADGILISTPEYIFSIPAGLKNALEWSVASTVFSDKPLGLLTASASGQKGHEELQLIMRTLMCRFTEETTLLIPGIKGKIDEQGRISDEKTANTFDDFIKAFLHLLQDQA